MLANGHVETKLQHYIHEYYPRKLGMGGYGGRRIKAQGVQKREKSNRASNNLSSRR
jgi:hypothetical protein